MTFLKIIAAMALTYASTEGYMFILSPILAKYKQAIIPCYFFLQFFNTIGWYKIFDL